MVESTKPGLVDLERELTCSVSYAIQSCCGNTTLLVRGKPFLTKADCVCRLQICTEILFQPLTLLDCLHTFCGSCLKQWFSWQSSDTRPDPFTCPSCRASVRDTRPNAGITTLLDMYLQANPGKGRKEQEKENSKNYKPGENVLIRGEGMTQSSEEVEDRRLVDEVRMISLQEVGIRGTATHERDVRHQARNNTRDARERSSDQRRDEGTQRTRSSEATDAASQARQVGHQSSLRSLISSSDIDSSDMEEEILRQIMDEGILDGIDLNNIDVTQEDELSEKIADAYRRRHGQRSRPRVRSRHTEASAQGGSLNPNSPQERQHHRPGRSPNSTNQGSQSSYPPVSRPHLFDAYPTSQTHRRRTSSETRRQTSPLPPFAGTRASGGVGTQAARSATDLTNSFSRSSRQIARSSDLSSTSRRTAGSETLQPRGRSQDRSHQHSRNSDPQHRRHLSGATSEALRAHSSPHTQISDPPNPIETSRTARSGSQMLPSHRDNAERGPNPILNDRTEQLPTYAEPFISCNRCQKQEIEHDLHWNCSICYDGIFNLCLRCYRIGRGCLYWYGFGHMAQQRYQSQHLTSLPHRLQGHRYLRPPAESIQPSTMSSSTRSTSDPADRLQSGLFCSNCFEFSPECYWSCEICNEGEWGFCNACVNQSKCCTHALLPIAAPHSKTPDESLPSQHSASSARLSPSASLNTREDHCIALTFSTKCRICTYPIPPSTTRFHCPQCDDGNYDLDANCYQRLVYSGKITNEKGPRGWRCCPEGHRMVIIGFEDSSIGQRRIIVEDLVGGHAFNNDISTAEKIEWRWGEGQQRQAKTISKASPSSISITSEDSNPVAPPALFAKYPPSGGVGMHVLAKWSWWPQEGADDELAFPKGAEIRECEDINGDWFWGVYCARKGLFPSNYGRIIERIRVP